MAEAEAAAGGREVTADYAADRDLKAAAPRQRVLVADPIADDGVERLRERFDVDVVTGQASADLLGRIGDYDALVVRSETKIGADHIAAATRLRIIGRAGVGVDNIDVDAASQAGILVVNAPAGNTIAAAEHTIGMLMALARNIPQSNRSLIDGDWDRKAFMGFQLRGKTLGVVGLGAIGSEVAKRAQGLEMEVIAHDPMVSRERAEMINVQMVELDELCRKADVITVHVPLVASTKHLFNAQRLAMCKSGVRLVNVARGGIYDEDAVLGGLESGKVAGFAADVFEVEPPPKDSRLVNHPHVVATPHLGASTEEAQVGVAADVVDQIITVLEGGPARWAVNAPTVLPEDMQALQPFVALGEKLGSLYAQAGTDGVEMVELDFTGELSRHDVSYVTAAVLRGLLSPYTEDRINVVNARLIAASRGIAVEERKSSGRGEYADLLTMTVKGKGAPFTAAATVLPQGPRLVRLGDFRIDVQPEGRFLVTYHDDRPGVIGSVGSALGEANINIAALQLGRDAPRGRAVMIVQVDDEVPDEVRARLNQIDGMSEIRYVEL
ncbi:MAG TPA: phosphoglycerate dehydrogenase [Candidatus Dormibacteraeota bacterium]|nr:phosphoglycerate dehydrogenase [Candidatus Dormibacteraeota bacterium]